MPSLTAVLGLATLFTAAVQASSSQPKWRRDPNEASHQLTDATPKRYIVELTSLSCSERVAARLSSSDGLRIVKTFDHELFPALSVECDNGCDVDSLTRLLNDDDGDDDHVHSTGARDVAAVYKPATMELRLPKEGQSFSDDAAAPKYSFHGLTGVEELHKAGIIGEGATVAIVDSGVDWSHPDLGNGFGPGHTIIGGYDLVGDGGWPDTPPQPDAYPDDQFGHGTHVAGIVAGKGKQFVGVAPGAKILSYKVISRDGKSNEEMVIEGFLKAFDSGADIISASLGEKSGWSTNAWATLASRMVDRGVFISIAGGNDGDEGAFLMSNGAAGEHVMTVAAADPDMIPVYPFTAHFSLGGSANSSELGYAPAVVSGDQDLFPSDVADWPVVPLSLNTSAVGDACGESLPEGSLPKLDHYILLVRVGGCDLLQKVRTLSAANVPYVLFYQDDSPYAAPPSDSSGITKVGVIDAKAGEAIVGTIVEGGNVTASFNESTTRYVGMRDTAGGRPAVFTQWGPNYDMGLKPDIMAPGSRVLSTYLGGGYKILSGTSMATPYVAGVAALYVGKHGGRRAHADDPAWAKRLMSRIMSTARSAPWVDEWQEVTRPEFRAPPVQVGAGLLDAQRVLEATTTFGFEGRKFELNDTAHFRGKHSVDITNAGEAQVSYTFSLESAAGFESWKPNEPGQPPAFGLNTFKAYNDMKPAEMVPEVRMPTEMTLQPGQSATAQFEFTPPVGVNASLIPVYGGRVLVHASNGEEFGIPYYGVASDIKAVVPGNWDRGASLPNMISGPNGESILTKTTLTFNLDRDVQDFPLLVSQTVFGCREIRWDIFDAKFTENDWSYPPVVGENHFVGSATAWSGSMDHSYFDPKAQNASDVYTFPRYNVPRSLVSYNMWLGQFANGSHIRPGKYQFRLAALRPFGDPHVAQDWDVFQIPQITVLPRHGACNKTRTRNKRLSRPRTARLE